EADILLFLTDHNEFKEYNPLSISARNKIVFDTKNCLNREAWQEAGFQYHLLGDSKNK
ncbi:UDP-N-acetyl-D-mannosamine dehydrogenase, partial [Butyricicoccus sp. 1XD8-22]